MCGEQEVSANTPYDDFWMETHRKNVFVFFPQWKVFSVSSRRGWKRRRGRGRSRRPEWSTGGGQLCFRPTTEHTTQPRSHIRGKMTGTFLKISVCEMTHSHILRTFPTVTAFSANQLLKYNNI